MLKNAIYATFQGEVNHKGIGHPSIFLRLQGCHLRCYKKTLGTLCDTPEALKKPINKHTVSEIVAEVRELSSNTGIKLVTLTGGDPLWNNSDDVRNLLEILTDCGFEVSIETSGTLSWLPYMDIKGVFFVLDYKLKSAGVKKAGELFMDKRHLDALRSEDFIKMVVYDTDDLEEAEGLINSLATTTKATLSLGAYWGGKLTTFEIFDYLKTKNLLGKATINMQTHKMALSSNYNTKIPEHV